MMLMFHDDSCGELLDMHGECPKCRLHPDMQSTGFTDVPVEVVNRMLDGGQTFMGRCRTQIVREKGKKT